jgi:hypothetical protein
MTTALKVGEGSASHHGRFLPPGKTQYQLYRRLGGTQGRSGQVRKISPTLGFDPRNVQPVASRYTDYANRPTFFPKTDILQNTYVNLFLSLAKRSIDCFFYLNLSIHSLLIELRQHSTSVNVFP